MPGQGRHRAKAKPSSPPAETLFNLQQPHLLSLSPPGGSFCPLDTCLLSF